MPDKTFLETYPLYRRFDFQYPGVLSSLPKPAVHMLCSECGSPQTFRMNNEYYENYSYSNVTSLGEVVRAQYVCSSGMKFMRYFFIALLDGRNHIMKVGQYPPWSIKTDPALVAMLGEQGAYYKNALICESQSYGIGAFAYYRRIVEEVIDELLDEIGELIPEEGAERYAEALAKTKQTHIAAEKIALVKDLLPGTLRPGDINPLSVLHTVLSEGLHDGSDEKCMEWAAEVRESLVFLVGQVRLTKSGRQRFTSQMRKLLDRG